MLFLVVNELQVRIHLGSVSRLSPTPHPPTLLLAQVKMKDDMANALFPVNSSVVVI